MRKFSIVLAFLVLVFGAVDLACALQYTDTHVANLYMSTGTSTSWTFDITGPDGFDPTSQEVTSASVNLSLTDDNSRFDFWEFANLRVGENRFFWEVDSGATSFSLDSLLSLNSSGTVNARLSAIWGDFWFNSATLSADATDPGVADVAVAPVPEPSTILLLGTGLMSLVVVSRKKLKN